MAIEFENIHFSYDGTKKVLDGLSLSLPEYGAVCLFGPSGCGKTTLLRLLAGLEKPQSGRITGLDNLRVSYVFQENRLLPWMSALDNVAIIGGENRFKNAQLWLERVGLGMDMHKYPDELSGGMRQRISIARALAAPFDILILDEPFIGLDAPLWKSIAGMIRESCGNKLVILVTHLIEQADRLGAEMVEFTGPPLRIVKSE